MTAPGTREASAPHGDLEFRGRMLVRGEGESACVLECIEEREARLPLTEPGVVGRRAPVVAYFDHLGRLGGGATFVEIDMITLTIEASEPKVARLHRQLAILAKMTEADRDELRGHGRIVPHVRDMCLVLPNGSVAAERLRDLSRSGAAVEVAAMAEVGDRVTIGSTRGRVSRTFDGGFAVEFTRLLPLESFGPACVP